MVYFSGVDDAEAAVALPVFEGDVDGDDGDGDGKMGLW